MDSCFERLRFHSDWPQKSHHELPSLCDAMFEIDRISYLIFGFPIASPSKKRFFLNITGSIHQND
ncbi:predicted protein [Sclerotinia sclerotiorum 1980 UF-70]|uniref:Uncharacterized protein n=1 Tax=Sclerotinia sclerotiorum (strain ATCC 18683 / 1980 / Ss-1) TaxID=665079 RepID=A7F777_SCLS1|nr:predicted protein [Sclerotinia sclerotiorum 1980 UF-70]EDN98598.1 predicted protein [Sclerotinia sclerotiorum 1980 UF-70]